MEEILAKVINMPALDYVKQQFDMAHKLGEVRRDGTAFVRFLFEPSLENEKQLCTVQWNWHSCMETLMDFVMRGFQAGYLKIDSWIAARMPEFHESINIIINGFRTLFSATNWVIHNISMHNFLVCVASLAVYALFKTLDMEDVGLAVVSCILMLFCKDSQFAKCLSWSILGYRLGKRMASTNITVNNVVSRNIPQVQSFEAFSPLMAICSFIGASLFGLHSFGVDVNSYRNFASQLDNHFKVIRSTRYIGETIGEIFDTIINYMGFEYCGYRLAEGAEMPEDIDSIIRIMKSFDAEKRREMVTRYDYCKEAERMFQKYIQARIDYRSNRGITQLLDKIQGPIVNLHNRAISINPSTVKNRVEPVVLMLHGESGVGKSTLLYHLGTVVLSHLGIITPDMSDDVINDEIRKSVYARMIEQEFWDGYNKQTCVLIDDIFQKKDSVANPNDEYMELIRMSNPFPFPLHMAAVERKDNTAFGSKVVVGTTNLQRLVPVSVVSVSAVERRIDLPFTVTIKPEFADRNGRLRSEFQTGEVDVNVYNFQRWNTTTGAFFGEFFSFDEVAALLCSRINQKQVKHDAQQSGLATFARTCMAQTQALGDWLPVSKRDVDTILQGYDYQWDTYAAQGRAWDENPSETPCGVEQHWRLVRETESFERSVEIVFPNTPLSHWMVDDSIAYLDQRSEMFSWATWVCGAVGVILLGFGIHYAFKQRTKDVSVLQAVESGKSRVPVLLKNRVESGKQREPRVVRSRVEMDEINTKLEQRRVEGWASENSYDVSLRIRRNMRWIFFSNATEPVSTLFVAGRTFLLNKHYVRVLDECLRDGIDHEMRICNVGSSVGISSYWSSVNVAPYLRCGRESDLMVCQMPREGFNRLPNIVKHLATTNDLNNLVGKQVVMLVPNGNIDNWAWMEKKGKVDAIAPMEYQDIDGSILVGDTIHTDISSLKGDCGGVYIVDDPNLVRKVVGIHYAGGLGEAMAVPLNRADIERTIKEASFLDDTDLFVTDVVHAVGLESAEVQGNVSFLGKIEDAPYAPTETKIVKTKIFDKIKISGVAPALLRKQNGLHPMKRAIAKQFGPTPVIDNEVLAKASMSYRKMLAFSKNDPDEFRVLSFNTAVRGIEGHPYIKGINRSRSAGYPWSNVSTKGKTKWFGTHDWTLDTEDALEVKRTVEKQIDAMSNGISVPYLFVDTLKDETLPIEKVRIGKTRVFSAAPMDFIIVFRMYYLSFISFMMEKRIYNESAVGIKSQSMEWDFLVKHLRKKSDTFIAGDFSSYDGTLHPAILWEVFEIIETFYRRSQSYVPSDTVVRRMIWENVVNSFHIMNGQVYQLNHSQPSGNPATAVLNSMYNSLSMRYVWYLANSKEFNDYCDMIAYGDDNIIAINRQTHSTFNQDIITAGYEQIGMTYTDENKTGKVSFKNIEEISFLKRGFTKSHITGVWIAPLKLGSILECFNWTLKTNDEQQIMWQNAEMAFAELSLHPVQDCQTYTGLIEYWLTKAYGRSPIPQSMRTYHLWMRDGKLLEQIPHLNWQ